MATVNLGRIGFINKGVYASDATYEPLDVVNYNNAVYSALKIVKGIAPTDDGVNWRRMIDAGSAIENAITAAENANTAAERANTAAAEAEKYSDELGEVKADFNYLQELVGDEPASEESGLELLKTVSDSIELYGALVGIIENLPSDETAQELVAELNNENDILSKIVEDM